MCVYAIEYNSVGKLTNTYHRSLLHILINSTICLFLPSLNSVE